MLKAVREYSTMGLQVLFWAIQREQNTEADAAAKKAAELEDSPNFARRLGVMITLTEMVTLAKPYEDTE